MKAIILSALLSLAPIGELRAGIPFALAQGISPITAFLVSVIANSLVAPIMFIFLEYVHHHFLHIGAYRTAFDHFMERTRRKTHHYVEKYGYLGLAIFVAVPLPLTGAYTGALAAWFFGMNKAKATMSITIGVATAGLIVSAVVLSGVQAWQWITSI